MKLEYVPLLQVQRDLHSMPRDMKRFQKYLQLLTTPDGSGLEFPPLVIMNPMGKEHVTALLDALLGMDADGLAAQVTAEAGAELHDQPGEYRITLVVSDDLKGGWTNRYATEFGLRFGGVKHADQAQPRWSKYPWIAGVLWSSETPTPKRVRQTIRTAIYRAAYVQKHGPAKTLHDMLAQEGFAMARGGCTEPTLDKDDLEYTREVLRPYLQARDMRTAIECLFGDEPGRTLGFTPRGLSPWAGLALALSDARQQLQPILASAVRS